MRASRFDENSYFGDYTSSSGSLDMKSSQAYSNSEDGLYLEFGFVRLENVEVTYTQHLHNIVVVQYDGSPVDFVNVCPVTTARPDMALTFSALITAMVVTKTSCATEQ